jgi:hypothetical protein
VRYYYWDPTALTLKAEYQWDRIPVFGIRFEFSVRILDGATGWHYIGGSRLTTDRKEVCV